jgi:Cu/Ag efflux pump CusA
MGSVIGWALRFRLLVLAAAVAVMVVGVIQLRDATVDTLPEYAPPYAEIQTEALGLSAEEVEQLITVPMEADLLNGVEGIDVIRSESLPGLSSIVLVFEPGSDIYEQRQLVQERLTQAHALPHVSRPPELLQPLSASSRVLMVGLSSADLSRIEQSVIARWVMRPHLMGVPGVANASIWGMRDQQLQVQVDPGTLRAAGVGLDQVVSTAGNAQVVSPLTFLEASTPGTGGFIESPQQRLQVRHLIEKIADADALGEVPVEGTGGRLRLTDVSNVTVDHQPLIGDAVVNGDEGLILVVEKFPGADTEAVTEDLEDALEELQPGLASLDMDLTSFEPANYVTEALDNLALAGLVGSVLMVVALLAFRFRWRSALIAVVTIPLSLLAAALVLTAMGQTFNAITFAGLAAAVAIVVDEAIAPTDRVLRRLGQRRRSGDSTVTSTIVLDASTEARRPLLCATVISLLAVVPVLVMEGVTGDFFGRFATAYAAAVLAAMVVALTVTPALSSVLMSRWKPPASGGRAVRIRARTTRLLHRAATKPQRIMAVAGAAVVLMVVAVPFLNVALVPDFQDRNLLVELESEPGTSLERMTALSTELSRELQDLPGVSGTGAHVGRALSGDRVVNVNSASVWVQIGRDADYDATVDAIERTVEGVDSADHEVSTYANNRIREIGALPSGENESLVDDDVRVLSGTDQPLVVRIFGENLDELRDQAAGFEAMMAEVDGITGTRSVLPPVHEAIEIEVDLDKAWEFGVTPGYVRRSEATLVHGIQVGSVFEEQKVFDVIVRGTEETRGSVEDVEALMIGLPDGGYIRLGQVADVRVVDTPAVIARDSVSRYLDVQGVVEGRSVDAVVTELEERIATTQLPLEYHAEVVTESTGQEIGLARVIGFAAGVVMAMFLLLQSAFRSWRLATLTLAALLVSLVGGVAAVLIAGAELTLGSAIGLLAVFGLATRACLLMVVSLESIRQEAPDQTPRSELAERAVRERLTPVLTSAAALAALALPFVVLGPRAGLEVVHPMAQVVLGGLSTVVLVTLLLVPALCLSGGRRDAETAEADGEPELVGTSRTDAPGSTS